MPYRPIKPKSKPATVHPLTAGKIMARVKSSRVPEGGWTNETFRTRNGRELIRDLTKAHRAVIATGSRKLVPFLKKYFDTISNPRRQGLVHIQHGRSRGNVDECAR